MGLLKTMNPQNSPWALANPFVPYRAYRHRYNGVVENYESPNYESPKIALELWLTLSCPIAHTDIDIMGLLKIMNPQIMNPQNSPWALANPFVPYRAYRHRYNGVVENYESQNSPWALANPFVPYRAYRHRYNGVVENYESQNSPWALANPFVPYRT